MEPKKYRKYDLERKRPLFFGIGLIVTLGLVISAFEMKTEIDPIDIFEPFDDPITFIPIPVTTIPEPPKPKPIKNLTPDIDVVEEMKQEVEEIDSPEPPPIEAPIDESWIIGPEPEVVEEAPIDYAEIMPTYEGGMEQFYGFLGKNIKYPRKPAAMGIEGKVFVRFVVEKDGSLSNIQVIKGISKSFDQEAMRVMRLVEKFKPGKQGNIRVRVQMIVPIVFRLH